jgi:hypothetical protein
MGDPVMDFSRDEEIRVAALRTALHRAGGEAPSPSAVRDELRQLVQRFGQLEGLAREFVRLRRARPPAPGVDAPGMPAPFPFARRLELVGIDARLGRSAQSIESAVASAWSKVQESARRLLAKHGFEVPT